ncbi:VanZ family protein [Cereibacter sphaeroides]|nr:VanZ family protein [Cereibacter sphaeroides]
MTQGTASQDGSGSKPRPDLRETEDRLKTMRRGRMSGGGRAVGSLGSMLAGQVWVWQRSGLILGMIAALLIAGATLSPMPPGNHLTGGIDKVYHFIAFATLIFPLILTDSRRWSWAVPGAILYGGLIELIQPSVGRSAEWLDFGADIAGVLAGAALSEILHDRIRAKFFAVDETPVSEADAEAEALEREAMRAELMDELRVALREELHTLRSETPEADTDARTEQRGS